MTKFSFRLQAVLKLKSQLEEKAKGEFAMAMLKLQAERRKLQQIQQEQSGCMEELRQHEETGITVGRLKEFNAYIMLLRDHITEQKIAVNEARENADKHREKLIKAVQEREILEKLRERKYEEFLQSVRKDEQKHLDEVAGYKYYLGMAGE